MKNDPRADELLKTLHAKVSQLASAHDWKAMLNFASNFHNYSANNVLLILIQRPDASRVAGFKTWQQQGRQVRKGEKGIAILAPNKRWVEKEDDDGRKQRRQIVTGFRVTHVFDIAQTDGPAIDLPPSPTLLEGEAPDGLRQHLIQSIQAEGFVLRFPGPANWHDSSNGWTDFAQKVVAIRPQLSDAQQAKTLAHELGHVLLHDGTEYFQGCRGRAEVEAESVAAVICMAAGLDSDNYSLGYVAGWSGGDMKLVLSTAERVVRAANKVLSGYEATPVAA